LVAGSPRGRISIVRVCIVYDCLYPYTIGGAERWYRNLAARLAATGHEVTFLTRRQWAPGETADFDGVRVLAVSPRMELYAGGWRIQRACITVPQRAFCFSRLHEQRLREQGFTGELTRLEGQYAGPAAPAEPAAARPVVVFAGRHIPEKRVTALVPALAELPDL